jgi:hypothetical protein
LQSGPDGNVEIFIGGPQRGPNWLPTTAQSRKLFLRQGFDSWEETPAQLSIERIGMSEPRPLPTPDTVIAAMAWAGQFVEALMDDWPDHPYRYSPFVDPVNINQFPAAPAGGVGADDNKRGRAVAHLCWELAEDEALIIEFDSHEHFWMLSNAGVFFNSFDYLYRPVSYTPARTRGDSDSKIRLILCHSDPGYHNWLDTQGFARGNITYRNLLSSHATHFRTQLVKSAELGKVLPAGTARVTGQERVEQMQARFAGIRRRYR